MAGAGAADSKLQKNITSLTDATKFKELDVHIRNLSGTDMRRHAWQNADSFSTVWVTCWPAQDAYPSDPEFAEVSARYLGLGSPACELQAGETIAGSKHTLDRHGLKLSSSQLPGDGWRTQHDAILHRITKDAPEMCVAVRPNVYGQFSACIPQEGRQRFDGQAIRKRQGLVPDLMLTLQWN